MTHMPRNPGGPLWRLAALSVAAALAGCGGSGGDTPAAPRLVVDDLAPGAYIASLGERANPTVGKYYAAEDGSRYLVVADGLDQATAIYRRATTGGDWVAVPGGQPAGAVKLLGHTRLPAAAVQPAQLAGSYRVRLPSGTSARFSIAADGKITPLGSACQISGQIAAHALPNSARLSLASSGCGNLLESGTGIAAIDADYAPAALRLLVDNGSKLGELWAYAD
ncbi:hypothetical protein GCM10027082_41260 [Comamonas humi]